MIHHDTKRFPWRSWDFNTNLTRSTSKISGDPAPQLGHDLLPWTSKMWFSPIAAWLKSLIDSWWECLEWSCKGNIQIQSNSEIHLGHSIRNTHTALHSILLHSIFNACSILTANLKSKHLVGQLSDPIADTTRPCTVAKVPAHERRHSKDPAVRIPLEWPWHLPRKATRHHWTSRKNIRKTFIKHPESKQKQSQPQTRGFQHLSSTHGSHVCSDTVLCRARMILNNPSIIHL